MAKSIVKLEFTILLGILGLMKSQAQAVNQSHHTFYFFFTHYSSGCLLRLFHFEQHCFLFPLLEHYFSCQLADLMQAK